MTLALYLSTHLDADNLRQTQQEWSGFDLLYLYPALESHPALGMGRDPELPQ